MAKLSSNNLTLEIRYKDFQAGDVKYEIGFLWENESMINDALLKRWSDYWSSRSKGYFLAAEYEKDFLIATITKALQTDEPQYWRSLDPDVTFAIYPKKRIPFIKPNNERITHEEETELTQKSKTKQLDDWFTVIAFVDAYNFQNSDTYCDGGIALHMLVKRRDVEIFCATLKEEYAEFIQKFKVDEYKPEYVVHQVVDVESRVR